MKKLTSILLILALVFSLAACSQTKQPDVNGDSSVSTSGDNTSPIPIAFIGSMTGLDEIYGYVSYSAAKMAVEQINEAGGVAGRQIELKFGLLEYKDFTASKLPYGSQRRVEIMRALMTDPKVLLLDEPAAGMNEEETATLAAMIKYLQKEYSLTILIIDHHMDLIMDICDRLSVINFGKLLMTGTPEQAQNDPKVIDAYLGVDD